MFAVVPETKWAPGCVIWVLIQERLLLLPIWDKSGPTEPPCPLPLILWQAIHPSDLKSEEPDAAKTAVALKINAVAINKTEMFFFIIMLPSLKFKRLN
jgi:hypothetical protein